MYLNNAAAGGGTGGGRSLNDLPMPGMGGMPNFSSMMDAVAPGAPGMGGYGGIPPVADPEQAFAQQLTQLEVSTLCVMGLHTYELAGLGLLACCWLYECWPVVTPGSWLLISHVGDAVI